jgi:hypothetical protein
MRLVLRRFITPRSGGTEIALWSPSRVKPLACPKVRRCVRLFARIRERSRERLAALGD